MPAHTFKRKCPVCGLVHEITVDFDKYIRWQQGGELIQNVWPEKTADEREMMISGTHPECWKKLFGEGES